MQDFDKTPAVIMPQNEIFKTVQEEVYKSALEIILTLSENYSISLMDISAICRTVLKKGE